MASRQASIGLTTMLMPGTFRSFACGTGPPVQTTRSSEGRFAFACAAGDFLTVRVHPLFTPSRMHMDQTYVFYAGLPYFFKEGRFDVIKELEIEATRDDEWVFSGYSFTDKLWMDRDGKLHEGDVPEEQQEDLWGVGFYNRTSRDAFMALWLDHSSENFDGIQHGGEPTLNYDGHGQLWSRYPAESAKLQAGASIRQRNAYVVAPYPAEGGAEQLEQLRRRLLHPLAVVSQPLSARCRRAIEWGLGSRGRDT